MGQPAVCITKPGLVAAGVNFPQLFDANAVSFAGRGRASSLNLAMSCLPKWPRAPSANTVYLPSSSMPSWKLSVRFAVFAHAHVAGGHAFDSSRRRRKALRPR